MKINDKAEENKYFDESAKTIKRLDACINICFLRRNKNCAR